MSDFEKTSKNDKHKSIICKIVPKDEPLPVNIPMTPPQRAESPKPQRSDLEKIYKYKKRSSKSSFKLVQRSSQMNSTIEATSKLSDNGNTVIEYASKQYTYKNGLDRE